jgi:2'-5' RNA ligase
MENWTEVSFLSFPIPQVLILIQNKTDGAKNKVCKVHEANMYLTLKFLTEFDGNDRFVIIANHKDLS